MAPVSRLGSTRLQPMIGEDRQLLTNEPVEFEKTPVEAQECRKIIDHLRGIYRISPILIKENRLDLQTLGSQPMIMPKNLPDQWSQLTLQALLRPRDIRENSDARPSGHLANPTVESRYLVIGSRVRETFELNQLKSVPSQLLPVFPGFDRLQTCCH
jgi:hypothetical protein